MTAIQARSAGAAGAALRLLAPGALAATLAGCYQHTAAAGQLSRSTIRQRHPITLKQGRQTVEVFLGRYRGGLTPSQRADVLAFAQQLAARRHRRHHRRRALERGDRPGRRRLAARDPFDLRRLRRAAQRGLCAPLPAHGPALASIKLNYSKLVAEAGPCGLWPKDLGPAAATPT